MIKFWSEQEFSFEQNERTERISTRFNETQYLKVLIAKGVQKLKD